MGALEKQSRYVNIHRVVFGFGMINAENSYWRLSVIDKHTSCIVMRALIPHSNRIFFEHPLNNALSQTNLKVNHYV